MELYISIIGALVAVIVSILGAILANRNTIILQTRKLKEEHYIAYIEALHNLAANNTDKNTMKNYVFARDKLLLIAKENVIIKLLAYENEGVGKHSDLHDKYLTELLKAIRKDLKLTNKALPILYLKK
ncbi:hypothetical protein [Odoribacter laneus]|uniref:Uncharacterized protein n=1 Tax=Odoribacter laneus YIT 12061 TaxID=742817 RepID=H1DF09_9BACT|nr:hypothetical protein [Odoribacter laneus]EHP49327.1 hypothetical protein HMPREF9449_00845 [Odoribacter laneus YIT 12061]